MKAFVLEKEDMLLDRKRRMIVSKTLFTFICVLGIVATSLHLLGTGQKKDATDSRKKNIIFMVTDGMGPTSLSLARSFKQLREGLGIDNILELERHLIGVSRTRSNSSLITDSAAGATAFSCGLKTYNEAVGVDSNKKPCGTILEALKLQGYMTGLVVTTSVTDATPAAFGAHVDYRFQEDLIAQQQLGEYPLGRVTDLLLGGGRCHYLPGELEGGCRKDSRNLIEDAKLQGWSYVGNKSELDNLDNGNNVKLPLLGLFAPRDIPYEIDRNSLEHPSLAEEVKVALNALHELTKSSDNGFFLLIEGSLIDHAGHENDPAAQVREVLAYNEAFKEVIKYIDETDTETVVISTSDHETGGLATARQVTKSYPDYLWYPEVLLNSTHSGHVLSQKIIEYVSSNHLNSQEVYNFIEKEIIQKDMGITDYSEPEVRSVVKSISNSGKLMSLLNDFISRRSQTGWSTSGHSAVDVNVYAYLNSPLINNLLLSREKGLLGNHENIEIGHLMQTITGANLTQVTELIKDTEHSPAFIIDENIDQLGNFYHDFAHMGANF